MADFCKQCSEELFSEDFEDFKGLGELEKDYGHSVLCEGCGPTLVDNNGYCITRDCLEKHGENKV